MLFILCSFIPSFAAISNKLHNRSADLVRNRSSHPMDTSLNIYKNKLQNLRKIILFLCIAAFIFTLISCENEMSKIKVVAKTEDPPKMVADGFEMLYSDSSIVRFKLQTPELIWHDEAKDPYQEFPEGIKIVKYDSHMDVVSNITAQYAKYFINDDRFEAKNNVVAINQKGDTLKTEYLVWDNKKGKIYSDQFVKIIQKDQIFTGIGIEANQDFTSYHIKDLKGHIYIDMNK